MNEAIFDERSWREQLAPYKTPSARAAFIQLANTALPFALLWYLMARASRFPTS